MELIISRDNKNIRHISRLFGETKYRNKFGEFAIEGARLCKDAALSAIRIKMLFYTEKAEEVYNSQINKINKIAEDVKIITEDLANSISMTKTPQGVFCICENLDIGDSSDTIKMITDKKHSTETMENPRNKGILALENIQNPKNLGTIIRTAEALNVSSIILSHDCVDIYNPRVIRGSMGGIFRIKLFIHNNFPKMIEKTRSEDIKSFACVSDKDAVSITDINEYTGNSPYICLVGNEGAGLTNETVKNCYKKVTIPMKGEAESLNVAMAAGIVLWEMSK